MATPNAADITSFPILSILVVFTVWSFIDSFSPTPLFPAYESRPANFQQSVVFAV
jgi:hypothetical protein